MRLATFAPGHSLFLGNGRRASGQPIRALAFVAATLLALELVGAGGVRAEESGPVAVNSVLELEADDLAGTAGVLAPFASFEEDSTIVIDLGARDLEIGPQGAILVPPSRQFAFPDPPAFGPEEGPGRGLGSRPAGPERWGGGNDDDDEHGHDHDDDDHHGGGDHHGDDDDDHGHSGDRGSPHLWIKSSGSLIVRAPSEADRPSRNGGGHHDDDDHYGDHDDDGDDQGGPNLPRGAGAIETSARKGRAGDIFLDFGGSVVVLGSVRSIQEQDPNNSVSTAGAITLRSAGGDVIVGVGGLVANWGEKPGTGPISLVSCGGDVAVQGLVLNRKGLFAHHPPVINVASFAGDVHIDGGALALNDFQPAGPKMDLTGGLMTFSKGSEAAGRIDIEALGDVFISRDTTGVWLNRESRAAVANVHHENEGDNGGTIRVRALEGSIAARDRALEAVGKKNNSAAFIELFAEQDVELLTPAAPWGQRSPTIDVDHEQNSHHARGGTCQLRSRSGSVIVEAGAKVEAEKTVAKVSAGGTVQILPGAVVAGLQTQVEQAAAVEGLFGGCGDFGELPALPAVQFNPAVYTASEAANAVLLTVELDSALAALLDEPASVDYATADETALAGLDYQAVSGTLVFALGETSKTLEIALLQDQVNEPAETFRVLLSNPSNAVLGEAAEAVVALENDPIPQIGFRVAALAASEAEGGALAVLEVELLFSQGAPASVDFASEDLSALAGEDYEAVSGTLTFEPGEFLKTIEIPILADQINEPAEDFRVSLSNPLGAILGLSAATVSIENLFLPPTLGFAETFFPVMEDSTNFMVELTVEMTGPETLLPAAVAYRVLQTARSPQLGLDYEFSPGVLNFLPGERIKTFQATILADDESFEPEESLVVILENYQNAKIGAQVAEILISDPSNFDQFPQTPDPVSPGGETIETEIPFGGMFCYQVEVAPSDGHLLVKTTVEEDLGDVTVFISKSPRLPTISEWDYASLTQPSEEGGGDAERVAITPDGAIPLEEGTWFICVYGSGPNETDPDAPIPVVVTIDPGPGAPPAEEEDEPEPPVDEGVCGQRRPLSGFSGTDSQNTFALDDPEGEFAPPSASTWTEHNYALWCFQFDGEEYGSFVNFWVRAPQAAPEDRIAIALRTSCAGGETLDDYASIEDSAWAPGGVLLNVSGVFDEFFTVVVDTTSPLNIELTWQASTALRPACDRAGDFIDPCAQRTALIGFQGRALSQRLGLDGTLEGLDGFGCANEPGGLVGEYWTAFSLTTPEAGFIQVDLEQRLRPLGDLVAELRSCCDSSAEGAVVACARSQPNGEPKTTLAALLPAPGTYTIVVNASRSDPPVTVRWNSEFYLTKVAAPSDCQVVVPQIVPSTDPGNPVALPDKAFVFADIGAGETHHYAVEMPASIPVAASLRLTLETPLGSGADPDLYVRQSAAPTLEEWDLRPFVGGGAREFVWLNASTNPPLTPGDWRVAVYGARPGPYRLKATFFEPNLPPLLPAGRPENVREVEIPEDCPHINNEFIPEFLLKYFCDPKSDAIDVDVLRGTSNVGFSEEYRNLYGALIPANNNFDKRYNGEPLFECLDGLPVQDNSSFSPLVEGGEIGVECPPRRFIYDLNDTAIARGRVTFHQSGIAGIYPFYTTDFGIGFDAYTTILPYRIPRDQNEQISPKIFGGHGYVEAGQTIEFLVEGLRYGQSPFGPKMKSWLELGTLDSQGFFHADLAPIQEESVRMRVTQALFRADLDFDFYWTWDDVRARGTKPGLVLSTDSIGVASPTVHLGGANIIADKILFPIVPPEMPQVYLMQEGEGRVDVMTPGGRDILPFDQNQSLDLAQRQSGWEREFAYQSLLLKPRIPGQLKLKFVYTLQGLGEGGGFAGDFIVGDELQITIEDLVDLDVDSDNDNEFSLPEQDDEEDAIEYLAGEPGKLISVNAGDFDADGIFDQNDYEIGPSPSGETAHFTPIVLTLRQPRSEGLRPIDPAKAEVVLCAKSPFFEDSAATGGFLRIWTQDAGELRDPAPLSNGTHGGEASFGHWIAPGAAFNLADTPAGADADSWVFYLEGMAPGSDTLIALVRERPDTLEPGQFPYISFDQVKVTTASFDIKADVDNNGSIDEFMDDPLDNLPFEETFPGMFVRVNNDDDDLDGLPDNHDIHLIENENSRTTDKDDLRPLIIKPINIGNLQQEKISVKLKIEDFGYESSIHVFQFFQPAGDPIGEYQPLNFDANNEAAFSNESTSGLLNGEAITLYVEGVQPSEVKLEASLFYGGHLAAQDTVAITVGPPNIDADTNNDGFFTVQGDDPWEDFLLEETIFQGMIINLNNDDDNQDGLQDRLNSEIDENEDLKDFRKIWIRSALIKDKNNPIFLRKKASLDGEGKARIFTKNQLLFLSDENNNMIELNLDINGNLIELILFIESTEIGALDIEIVQNEIILDKIVVHTPIIYTPLELTFKDTITLISDDETINYTAPHFLNYHADLTNFPNIDERLYPICYEAGSKIKVDVKLQIPNGLKKDDLVSNWLIRGSMFGEKNLFPNQFVFNKSIGIENTINNSIEASNLIMIQPLDNKIDYFGDWSDNETPPLLLHWEISPDNGERWYYSGVSGNYCYIINSRNGILPGKNFHTLFYNACKFAKNADINNWTQIKDNIWYGFKLKPNGSLPGPVYRTKSSNNPTVIKDTPMGYWLSPICTNKTTQELISTGDGQCGAWARFYLDVLKVHGIKEDNNLVEVSYNEFNTFPYDLSTWFLVKNWDFLTPTVPMPGDIQRLTSFDYMNIPVSLLSFYEVKDMEGISGQGNIDPNSEFQNHFFCRINTDDNSLYLDPSYGVIYIDMIDFEDGVNNSAISGFSEREILAVNEATIPRAGGGIGIDVNHNGSYDLIQNSVHFIKKNDPSNIEMKVREIQSY